MKEILIRLEDELYEQCKNTELTEENEGFDFHIIKSVANGTVLPKGHGRLIDENDLWFEDIDDISCVTQRDVENAPTIIEADKESE